MTGPTKSEALGLFSYPIPGYRIHAVWVDDELVPTPENVGLVLPGRELFTAPLPWAQFETSRVNVPVVTNVETWRDSAAWSAPDGSVINTDAPTWTNREIELSQLAAQLTVDTAVDVGQSAYNIHDAALRALAEMMMTAMYRQLCSKTPDADGPASFYILASDESKVVDADSAPFSFDLLMCLRQQVDVNEGCPEQYSILLGRDIYGDFVQLMTGVGLRPELDPITKQKQWFFDRVRVVESGYVADGNGMIFKADLAVLPEALRARVSPGVGRGVVIGSTHAQGVVVSSSKADETTDQSETTLQLNVGLVHCDGCVGWVEDVGT